MPAEAGDDVESSVVPRQGVHVANPQVGVRTAVPGDRDEPGRRIDARAPGPAQPGQLHRQARPAGDVEQPVAGADAQVVVQATYSRQLVGSQRVANSTAWRPQPSSTPRHWPSVEAAVRSLDPSLLVRAWEHRAGEDREPQASKNQPVAVRPSQITLGDGQGQLGEPPEQGSQGDPALHPCQRGAEAVVDPVPEGQVTAYRRSTSNVSGRVYLLFSLFAEARQMMTWAPFGITFRQC